VAVSGAVVAALTAVGLLIYYVHHVAVSMQVTEITHRISGELDRAIERLYPESIGDSPDPPTRLPPPPPEDAVAIPAPASGYIREIDEARLLRGAAELEATIWLTARPGNFVLCGERIGCLRASDPHAAVARAAAACIVGTDRTSQQDAAFGIQQLVEVVLRALSPGTNEPYTAITAVDALGRALSLVAARRIPNAARVDDGGRVRLVTSPRTFAELAEDAFGPIADYGGAHPVVCAHVFDTMGRVMRHTRRAKDAATIRRLADRFWGAVDRSIEDEERRALLMGLYTSVRRAAEDATSPSQGRVIG
jgi:uncharacterized membrane protein